MATKAIITSAENLTDTSNPRIYYEKPTGAGVESVEACISFSGAKDDIPYRPINKTGSEYTFNLTEAERITLRKGCIDSTGRTVRFYVRTKISGEYQHSFITRTLTIVDAVPEFYGIDIIDTNTVSANLTGDNKTLIKGVSIPSLVIGVSFKKFAVVKSIVIENGTARYTTTTLNSGGITLPFPAQTDGFKVTIEDSRGYVIQKIVTASFLNYWTPQSFIRGSMDSTGLATINVSVEWDGVNFGAVENKATLEYRWAESEFTNDEGWITLPSPTSLNWETEVTLNLDYTKIYVIQARASDLTGSVRKSSIETILISPLFDWSKKDFNFNCYVKLSPPPSSEAGEQDEYGYGGGSFGIYVPEEKESESVVMIAGVDSAIEGTYFGDLRKNNSISGKNVFIGASDVLGEDTDGVVNIDGKKVFINGCRTGSQNIIHNDTGRFIHATQYIYLKEEKRLTAQLNGYILCWSRFTNGAVSNSEYIYTYVPKAMLNINEEIVLPVVSKAGIQGVKTLHITDDGTQTTIQGDANNSTGNNAYFALRYVIGY